MGTDNTAAAVISLYKCYFDVIIIIIGCIFVYLSKKVVFLLNYDYTTSTTTAKPEQTPFFTRIFQFIFLSKFHIKNLKVTKLLFTVNMGKSFMEIRFVYKHC